MSYVADLIARFRSREELPQSGPFRSSKDTVSFQAHREAEKLEDIGCLNELEDYYAGKKRWQDVRDVAFICSWLIHNTGSEEARNFYISLKYKGASSETMMYLIDGATRASIGAYAPVVREMMSIEKRSDIHYSSGIQYLAAVLGEEAVSEIGEILDNDCYGRCTPFYCCQALEEIGSPRAIPYLKRAVERNEKGRKGWQRDAVAYSVHAIEKIEERARRCT